jgi:hypothetical protein
VRRLSETQQTFQAGFNFDAYCGAPDSRRLWMLGLPKYVLKPTVRPEARLAKKGAGKEARLCYTERVLMENRNGHDRSARG